MRAVLIALAFTTPAGAESFVGPAMDFFETGVICPPEPTGTRIAPGTVAGTTHVIEEAPPFVSHAGRVPAVIGIGFGIKSTVVFAEGVAPVTMRVTHPPMGPDGVTEQTYESAIGGGPEPSVTFYQFDYDYELVEGTWTMQAFVGQQQLYEVSFDVLPPDAVPELAGVCGFENLLS